MSLRLLISFLLPLILWGCGLSSSIPIPDIAIKVASTYCEANGGTEWIAGSNLDTYQFRCKNGLTSDWQQMTSASTRLVK